MILYHALTQCSFLCRVNRFIARCLLNDEEITVHVKNTGRLGELLLPNAVCWVEKSSNPQRKTLYDLVAVEKNGRIINIDSQAPNLIAHEWLSAGGLGDVSAIQREYTHGDSRFDLTYLRNGIQGLVEVKGVTLFDEKGMACFPDAPTSRGTKHLHGLIRATRSGMETIICFVIMNEDAIGLMPNERTDPAFAAALRHADAAGVRIVAAVCRVTADEAAIIRTVPVHL